MIWKMSLTLLIPSSNKLINTAQSNDTELPAFVKMEVKANVNRLGKISQIKPLHLEVSSLLIAKVQAESLLVQVGESLPAMMQLRIH